MAGGLAGGVLLAGCSARPARPVGVPDLLLAETPTGLALVHGIAARALGSGLPTPAGTSVYAARPAGDGTVLSRVDARTFAVTGRTVLAGRWVPRVVSSDGRLLALTAPGPGPSPILVVDGGRERSRLYLPGNCQPDAFARDGAALFVLARAGDRYRVRLVDLASGAFTPMLTRDKVPVPLGGEDELRGTARTAVLAPGGGMLYTLYTQQGGEGSDESAAFVHTLDLTVGWAYCLDLPAPLGTGPAAAHTIAVTPDGRRLLVADLSSGHLVIAHTDALTVEHVLGVPTGTGTAYAVAPDGSELLYLGIGTAVTVVDVGVLNTVARWDAGGEVRGLAVSPDGTRLLVGYPGAVGWRAVGDGRPLGRVPVPGLTRILTTVGP